MTDQRQRSENIPREELSINVLARAEEAPALTAHNHSEGPLHWSTNHAGTLAALDRLGIIPHSASLMQVVNAASDLGAVLRVDAPRLCLDTAPSPLPPSATPQSTVLCVIPHFNCEQYLHGCLHSMVHQTRKPDAIVVIDDASEQPPLEIVEGFPTVSLYGSEERVGPYRLVDSVLRRVAFDYILFQDADDFSCPDRLEQLLAGASQSQAALVGSQELRIDELLGEVYGVCYPLDVNAALTREPGHPLLHPTSLLSLEGYRRMGGFATELRFGADTEFILRAAFRLRIINLPQALYVRRCRPGSLTTDPETGLESPQRLALQARIKARALENRQNFAAGKEVHLQPLSTLPPLDLQHLQGPLLWPTCL